jgi:hypothetical protein
MIKKVYTYCKKLYCGPPVNPVNESTYIVNTEDCWGPDIGSFLPISGILSLPPPSTMPGSGIMSYSDLSSFFVKECVNENNEKSMVDKQPMVHERPIAHERPTINDINEALKQEDEYLNAAV